jgi:predicted Zn-ribbon and HTH transcriptional regulator
MGLVGAFHVFVVDRSEASPDRVSRQAYRCTECDNEVRVDPVQNPPRCLICKSNSWAPLGAGEEPFVVRRAAKR